MKQQGLRRLDPNMDFTTFQDMKADIWSYGTKKLLRIVKAGSATRKERAKETDYWRDYQNCAPLFGERRGVLPFKQLCSDWRQLVKQSNGCLSGALARLAVNEGDDVARLRLQNECGHRIPKSVIEAGLSQKAKFAHMI